ncbi:hypothetical protein FOL46_003331, partial [Perkinsus olseni]
EESQATPRQVDAAAAVTRDRHALPPGAQPASASSSSSTAKAPVRPGFAAKSSPAARPSLTIGIPIRRSPPPPAPPAKQAGVPTPAAREFTAAVAATHYGQSLVGSDHHQVGSLKRYAFNWDGSSKGQTDVEEFLDKLNIIATGLQLSDEATLCLLTLSVTDGAYATVSSLLGRSTESAATRLTTVKAELRRRYGATPVKSFKDLSKVVLTDFDSIDALAVKLRKLTIQAFPALHADAVDQVCKMFFFSLLPENHSATAQLLPSMLDTEKSTAQLVHLARHSFEDLMAQNQASRILAVAPFYGQSSHSGKGKGSGGKGRGSGKGKGKGRFGLHKPL